MSERADFRILMILTSHEQFGDAGDGVARKTGVWLESFVSPYFILRDAGAELTLASPAGGKPPIDPASRNIASRRFAEDEFCGAALADTLPLQEIYAGDFDAAFYPGGFGAYWDLASDRISADLIASLHGADKPIALVSQAVIALCPARSPNGRPLVEGKRLTGFSDQAASAAGLTTLLPRSLEKSLGQLGAVFSSNPDTDAQVVCDGLLITGESVTDSAAVARMLLQALSRPDPDTQIH